MNLYCFLIGGIFPMKLLEDRITEYGAVRPGNVLKVDCFLNHQMDISLFQEMGKEWKRLFSDCNINKILTIETSGIGIAAIVSMFPWFLQRKPKALMWTVKFTAPK